MAELEIIEHPDGTIEWQENGEPHREREPALIWPGGEAWYYHGECHRSDGPAVINSRGDNWWWLNGARFNTIDEYLDANNYIDDEDKTLLKLKYG